MNKFFKLFLKIAIILVIAYCGYWVYLVLDYYNSLKRQENEWVDELKRRAIKGKVISFISDEDNITFHTLNVENSGEILTYGISSCEESEEFIKYIAVGDSVLKNNDSLVLLVKRGSEKKIFNFPFCP